MENKVFYANTIPNVNENVYAYGMKPSQITLAFLGIIFITLALLMIYAVLIFLIVPALLFVLIKSFSKASKENTNGNPDYIQGYIHYKMYSKYFEDNDGVISLYKANNE